MSSENKLRQWAVTLITSVVLAVSGNIGWDMVHAPSDNRVQDVQIQTLTKSVEALNESLIELKSIKEETIRAQGRDQVLDARMDSLDKNLGYVEKRLDSVEGRVDVLEGKTSS